MEHGDIGALWRNFLSSVTRCQIIYTATIVWDPRNCRGIGEGQLVISPFVSFMYAAIRGTSLQFDRIPHEITLHYVPTV